MRVNFSSWAICIALLLQMNLAVAEPYKLWAQLTPMQQEALHPLAANWDSLPTKLQKHLLHATGSYTKLSPVQKQRFHSNLEKWSKLTPEQRARAREKYRALRKIQAEKRLQEERKSATSSVPPAMPAR